jgi:hypothetical protein
LPELFGGASALEPLGRYLADRTRWAYGRVNAAGALEKLAKQHPELREQVIALLRAALEHPEHNHEVANTGAIDALVELGAVEALPQIRRAFEIGQVDEMVRGDWGDILSDWELSPSQTIRCWPSQPSGWRQETIG